jgi:hypothetical protein
MAADPGAVPPEHAWVRMYRALDKRAPGETGDRGLLGDCFLIGLEGAGRKAHILIDCGMLQGSPDAKPRMIRIAEDIRDTCGGKLDLVIVTHEHHDHISGFAQAYDIFFGAAGLTIGRVWMAWTEKPGDPQAERLRTKFDRTGFALAKIGARLRDEPRFGADVATATLFGLDQFMGPAADAQDKRPRRLSGRAVMEMLKTRETRYLEPGALVATPGAVWLRAYVLGPPRDEEKLFKDRPSAKNPETYLDEPGFDGQQLMRFAEGEDPDPARDSPFASDYCRFPLANFDQSLAAATPPEGAVHEFVREHYYGVAGAAPETLAAMARRRIDNDWLGGAGAMALKLDSDTNNTSLVLAFELPDEARSVLLFPGDAQVGNWQSWQALKFTVDDGTQTANDLLARTLLYKVGHHGSHNATLSADGLERMTNPALFAMIPTDEALGKQQGSGWQMPNPNVNAVLRVKTGGRILRNDRRYDGDRSADPATRDVPDAFLDKLVETDLFLQYPVLERTSA